MVAWWMRSAARKKNIVYPKFREIGVGTARGTLDGHDTVYVVQLFGTPAVTPTPASNPTPTSDTTPILTTDVTLDLAQTDVPEDVEVVTATNQTTERDDLESNGSEIVMSQPAEVLASEDTPSMVTQPTTQTETVEDNTVRVVSESESTSVPLTEEVVVTQRSTTEVEPEADVVPEQTQMTTTLVNDVVVVESELSTSSGLAVATVTDIPTAHAGATIASIATRPNLVIQILYAAIVTMIVLSLAYALVVETRRMHYLQAAYSLLLMGVMGGLWYIHTMLTGGAVIV